MLPMTPTVLRNALIALYGNNGYITKFSRKIGRRRQTVHKWLNGNLPVPRWAEVVATLLLKEKKQEERDGQRRPSDDQTNRV